MNRLKTFMAVSALAVQAAWACGPFIVEPRDFVLYRLDSIAAPDEQPLVEQRRRAGLQAWCEQGEGVFTIDEVERVMSYPVWQLEKPQATSNNGFERWLAGNKASRDYLVFAKRCEYTRDRMADAWYYPGVERYDGTLTTLPARESEARRHAPSEVQGRYVLQAVRLMVSDGRYKQCLEYWDSVQSLVTCEAVRDMIEADIVGCRFHTGDSVQALRRFIELGDVRSAQYCAKKMGVELLDYADANPTLPFFHYLLADYLKYLDRSVWWAWERDDEDRDDVLGRCRHRREECRRVARQHPANAALWYYAAAAMSDALRDYGDAARWCDAAMSAPGHAAIADYARVLKFHAQAQRMPVGAGYERMVERGTRMLASLIDRDLDRFTARTQDRTDPYDNYWRHSLWPPYNGNDRDSLDWAYDWYHLEPNFYWNNMLERIVNTAIAPRLLKAGRPEQALMMANMACNYLNHKTGARRLMQRYDNTLFEMADTLPVRDVERYRARVAAPHGHFERWLVRWGYNDADYWNELLGTQCLREMRYDRAVTYFKRVSRDYQQSMNIWPFLRYDPMRHQVEKVPSALDYKLHYAQAMAQAQRYMAGRDRDWRAHGMMLLATGLTNTLGDSPDEEYGFWNHTRYWPLLHYSNHSFNMDRGRYYYRQFERQRHYAQSLIKRAYATFADRDLAAQWRVEWCQYKQAIDDYPETSTAAFLGAHCDNLKDYYAQSQQAR